MLIVEVLSCAPRVATYDTTLEEISMLNATSFLFVSFLVSFGWGLIFGPLMVRSFFCFQASPAKLRLAFEAAPFGRLVEMAGGKTSDGVSGNSVLDMCLGLF